MSHSPISPTGAPNDPVHLTEMMPVAQLTPRQANPRVHSKKQIKQIARSIERFGFNSPVLIDNNGGIVAGHGRVAAAKLLGTTAIPVRRLSHLSPEEVRAYVIADNRLGELAGWDSEMLAIELQAVIDIGIDVQLTGFEMGHIDIILQDAQEARREDADHEEEILEPSSDAVVSQLGDVWVLGQHRVICGDARDSEVYRRLLDGDKAEMVFTDPPYNLKVDGHVCGKGSIRHREFAMASGEMSSGAFTEFLETSFNCMVAHTTDGSIHYVCMDWRHLAEMLAAGRASYSELKNICVWVKTNAGMGSLYRSQHEFTFVWKSGTAPHINNVELGRHGRNRSNVWTYHGINTMRPERLEELAMHPTVKPVALVADAIMDCSRRNSLVLDPFAGSGTILIAAEQTGRRARAIEIDPRYIDVAVRRWQRQTGKEATLAETGQTFQQVQQVRGKVVVLHPAGNPPENSELKEAA